MEAVGGFLPILLLLVFAYLLIVRPARKRTQETAALQAALSKGDSIMLTSGIFGRVDEILPDDDVSTGLGKVKVELSPGVVVTVHGGAIGKIIADASPSGEDSSIAGSSFEHGASPAGAGDVPGDHDAPSGYIDSDQHDDDRSGTTGDERTDRGDARGAV